MEGVRELGAGESHRAADALLELRGRWETREAMAARVDAMRASDGYRLVASFAAGDEQAAAAAGFRVMEMLAWGRIIYVDDLVTRAGLRGHGHADAVMAYVEAEARHLQCESLQLDSGLQVERADAHRFYFRHRMRITSFHFARELT
jgi:GNAT superfamily N-acetyltransferase